MLQSYDQEIREKRRAARIFWVIVFIFATFLYFFFQGYYPSIRFWLRAIEEWHLVSGENIYSDIIQSFGIVNVSTIPADATIRFESGSYSNNEKKMVRYGDYSMHIERDGYKWVDIDFSIEKSLPYFIDKLTLLPIPRYQKWNGTGSTFTRISDSEYVTSTWWRIYLYDDTLSGWLALEIPSMNPIWEWYFLSGTSLSRFESESMSFERYLWSGATAFIRGCRDTVVVTKGMLTCRESQRALRADGQSFSGVIQSWDGYILTASGLIVDGEKSPYSSTGIVAQASRFISYDYNWYGLSGSILFPIESVTWNTPIDTGLDTVDTVENIDGTLFAIGSIGDDYFLSMTEGTLDEQKQTIIPFPRVDLRDMRIVKIDGNTFFKMRSTLLFMYHNSKTLEWIIDGDVLAFSPESALYKVDDEIWHVTWTPPLER